jgi:hypothetical protein
VRISYESKRFSAETLEAIRTANQILEEYEAQGYDLTLRQLFYQHVARGLIPNTERSYKRLGSIVNDARLAGEIDWNHIVDRTRNVRSTQHWRDPADIVAATARSYKVDLWEAQGDYVEVWIEKDALVGVIQGVSRELDVPYFSCRGYTSQSEMWAAGQRLLEQALKGKRITILHLGDHDPSGIDMTRDITDRLSLFLASDYAYGRASEDPDWDTYSGENQNLSLQQWAREALDRFTVDRIALNMDQVRQYNPPPNPAKVSDSRAAGYIRDYGHESWELDALPPDVLSGLVRTNVEALIDTDVWDAAVEREEDGQRLLRQASQRWEEIVKSLNGDQPTEENE